MAYPEKMRQRAIELYEGCSAAQVLKLLQKGFPEANSLDERTIRRWRNKKRLKEHSENITDIAASLLTGWDVTKNTPRGNQFDIFQYTIIVDDLGWGVTHEQLNARVQLRLEETFEQYSESELNYFMSHLKAISPEIEAKGIIRFARENPYELLETLKVLAKTKILKSKCLACQHWH